VLPLPLDEPLVPLLEPVPAGSVEPLELPLDEPLAPVLGLEPVPPVVVVPVAVVDPPLPAAPAAAAVFGGKLMSKFETVPLTSALPLKRSSSFTSTVTW
jgi:hypothetical protein